MNPNSQETNHNQTIQMDLRPNKNFPNWKMGVVISLHQLQVSTENKVEDRNKLGWVTTPKQQEPLAEPAEATSTISDRNQLGCLTTPKQQEPLIEPAEASSTISEISETKDNDVSPMFGNANIEELVNSQGWDYELTGY